MFTNLFSDPGGSKLRGKILEVNLAARNRCQRKMKSHGQRRKENLKGQRKLQREIRILIREADTLEPPMSTYEIARLTGIDQPQVSRLRQQVRANLTDELGE